MRPRPGRTRRRLRGSNTGQQRSATFHLAPVAPFRLDLTAWALRRRPRNAIDRWDGTTYRRAVATAGGAVEIAVEQVGSAASPRLRIVATPAGTGRSATSLITATLERALGFRVDLRPFYRMASQDRRLAPLVRTFRGVKPPRFPSIFEALVNAVACQQLSLVVGLEMLNRLAAACAEAAGRGLASLPFPQPDDIVRLRASSIQALGFSRQKTRALLDLSNRVLAGDLDLERLNGLDNETALGELMTIRGIGRWSGEYVLLRGLGRLDVFPGDDVGARNNLARWLGRRGPLDYEAVHRALRPWRPYAGMVYFHMLLAGLADTGSLALARSRPGA